MVVAQSLEADSQGALLDKDVKDVNPMASGPAGQMDMVKMMVRGQRAAPPPTPTPPPRARHPHSRAHEHQTPSPARR